MTVTTIFLQIFLGNLNAQDRGTFIDDRDGKKYKWVRIGEQVWMAENLAYACKGSGYFDLNKYGRIYDWRAAVSACPYGWHLPTDNEWKELELFIGMPKNLVDDDSWDRHYGNAGIKLKARAGWQYYGQEGNGNDSYGFTALPGGYFQGSTGRFMYYGTSVTFWTSTRELSSRYDGIGRNSMYKTHGAYCRCIKDN